MMFGAIGLATSLLGMGNLGTIVMDDGANGSREIVSQITTGNFNYEKLLRLIL